MSTQMASIRCLFKQVLGDPDAAGTFLREHLPPEIADWLSIEPPEPAPGSLVDLTRIDGDTLSKKPGCERA